MFLSLHKQPFVTTHFQFIIAHFVRHCALKMPCSVVSVVCNVMYCGYTVRPKAKVTIDSL